MRLKTPAFWYDTKNSMAHIKMQALAPFCGLYALGLMLSRVLNRPASAPPSVPVICVGNFIAGGAGKTPVALALMDLIKARGLAKNPCFLSRGYGGTLRGPVQVDLAHHTAHDVGDEALLLARAAPSFIAARRNDGAAEAQRQGHDLILMDDGLLNQTIAKTASLTVVDGRMGIGNGALLPAGPLRAPLRLGLAASDAVLMIGDDQTNFLNHVPGDIPRFSLTLAPIAPADPAPAYLAFCGIGFPEKFRASLHQAGLNVIDLITFPDHHRYTTDDMKKLHNFAALNNARLITTSKDAVKITPALASPDSFDILDLRPVWPAAMGDHMAVWIQGKIQ